MTTEAQKRAQKKYDDANKDKFKCIQLKLNRETDADILEKLASVSSMQGYIKALIRDDTRPSFEIPEKYKCRVEKTERGRRSYSIFLNPGWKDRLGMHIIAERTQEQALKYLENTTECNCDQCKKRLNK